MVLQGGGSAKTLKIRQATRFLAPRLSVSHIANFGQPPRRRKSTLTSTATRDQDGCEISIREWSSTINPDKPLLTFPMRSDGGIRKSLIEYQACHVQAQSLGDWLLTKCCQIQYSFQQSPNRQDARRKAPIPAYQEEGQPAKMRRLWHQAPRR